MNLYHLPFASTLAWRFPKLRRFLTRLLVRDREVTIELFGASLRVNTVKEIGYVNAYENSKNYIVFRDEASTIVNLALLLEPGDTFVDVGANVGLYSSVLSRLRSLCPEMMFYAFEANPDTMQRLRQSTSVGGVTVVNKAVSNHEGVLKFAEGVTSGVFGAVPEADQQGQTSSKLVTIETMRLDSYPIEGASLVLKIDVEGHEKQVLEGAEQYFKDLRVKAVYVDGFDDPDIPRWLMERGFTLYDGRTLQRTEEAGFSLLAVRKKHACVPVA